MQADLSAVVDAYLAWWDLAGVDCATSEAPTDWLRPAPAAARPASALPASASPAPAPETKPRTLDAFRTWLAEDAGQPERRWPGPLIMPQGAPGSPLMVITDMPDPTDGATSTLLSDKAGQLFDAMLGAIGLGRADIYLSSLFLSRPPGGMVEASDLAAAADRMRIHVALAAPQRLLILGDRTVRTFFPTAERGGMDILHFFNHDGGTVPALATFHPRLLLGQPMAKAECWRTLQRLVEEQHQ